MSDRLPIKPLGLLTKKQRRALRRSRRRALKDQLREAKQASKLATLARKTAKALTLTKAPPVPPAVFQPGPENLTPGEAPPTQPAPPRGLMIALAAGGLLLLWRLRK